MQFNKFNTLKILDDMYLKGYSSNINFLQNNDALKLNNEIDKIFEKRDHEIKPEQSDYWSFKLKKNILGKIQTKLVGQSEFIDKLINQLLNNKEFVIILDKLIGKNRKLSTLNIRRADSNTNYDGIHTDHIGMLSVSILANDHDKNYPTTCIIPKSHRSKLLIEDRVENLPTEIFSPFYQSLTGKAGSLTFFYNKTWHGMKRGNEVGTAIIFSFIAEGYEVYDDKKIPQKTFYGKNFTDVLSELFLSYLNLDTNTLNKKIIKSDNNLIDQLPSQILILNFYFYLIIFLSKIKRNIKKFINK